jgi:transposase-like protein
MNTYKRHRFPPEIISYAVWLYHRFNLSHGDIEDLLAERGIAVSHESIRLWCIKFGPKYARRLKRKHRGYGDTFYIDEAPVVAKISDYPMSACGRLLLYALLKITLDEGLLSGCDFNRSTQHIG